MVHVIKAKNRAATRAEGTFTNCGANGNDFELSYRCEGPACPNLDASLQNVICHEDGRSRLICSSNSKCQHDTPSYQSNFTFSQNEPDLWSPQMENEPDTWVSQGQHILIGGCAEFSLTSDGTQEGTQIDDGSQTDHCPNLKVLPSPSTWDKHTSVPTDYPQAAATQSPLVFASTATHHNIRSKSSKLLAFLLMALLLLPEVQASITYRQGTQASRRLDVSVRAGSNKVLAFAEELSANIEQRANSKGFDGKYLASRLVANTVSSVCQNGSQDPDTKSFAPGIVRDCIASAYASDPWPQPGLQFLAIFGASILCDYLVSEMYPSGRQFLPERCEDLQELMDEARLLTSTPVLPTSIAPSSSTLKSEGSHSPSSLEPLLGSHLSQPPSQSRSRFSYSSLGSTSDAVPSSQGVVSPSQLSTDARSSSRFSIMKNTGVTSVASDAFSMAAAMQPSQSVQGIVDSLGLSSITYDDSSTTMPKKTQNQVLSLSRGISGFSSIDRARFSVSDTGNSAAINSEPSSALILRPSANLGVPAMSDSAIMASISWSDGSAERSTMDQSVQIARPPPGTPVSASLASGSANLGGSHSRSEFTKFPSIADLSPSVTNAGASVDNIVTTGVPNIDLASLMLDAHDTPLTLVSPRFSTDSVSFLPSKATLHPQDRPHSLDSKASSVMRASHQTFTPHTSSRMVKPATIHSQQLPFASSLRLTSSPSYAATDLSISSQAVIIFESYPGHIQEGSTTVETMTIATPTYKAAPSRWSPHVSISQSLTISSHVTGPSAADRHGDSYTKPEQSGSASVDSRPMSIPKSLPASTRIDGKQPWRSLGAVSAMLSPGSTSERRMEPVPTPGKGFSASPSVVLFHMAFNYTSRSDVLRITATEVRSSAWPSGLVAMPPTPTIKTSSTLAPLSFSSHKKTFSMSLGSNVVLSVAPTALPTASVVVSKTQSSSDISFEPMTDQSSTTDKSLLNSVPAATVHVTVEVTYTTFRAFPASILTYTCAQNPDTPNFCLGSGCVNTLTNQEHCGKCNQLCRHECHRGVCVCPDLSIPDEKNRCNNGPGSGECLSGYTRNSFKVCVPQRSTEPPRSYITTMHASNVGIVAQSLTDLMSGRPAPVPAMAVSTGYPELTSMSCPHTLLNMCGGGCFNTRTESIHCGDCGISCGETCISGQCPSSPTMSPSQLASAEQETTASDVPRQSPLHSSLTPTAQPAALFIWRGIAGL